MALNGVRGRYVDDAWARWLEPIAVMGLAFAFYVAHFSVPFLINDELFHILAAQSWLEEGTLRISNGEYRRARAFTLALAGVYWLFGESETAARLFTVVLACLWAVVVFLWARNAIGRLAAWFAIIAFCTSPDTLVLSHFIRLYNLHGLVFFLGAAGTYLLFTRTLSAPAMAALAAGTIFCLSLAVHLQLTTVIGLIALILWAILASSRWWTDFILSNPRAALKLAILAVILLVVAAFVLIDSGLAANLLARYRAAPSEVDHNNILFYHVYFVDTYPVLWGALPLAALIAITRRRTPALFCVCMFAIPIVLHSFAGPKESRYVHYVVPYFFIIWGIAVTEAMPWVRDVAVQAMGRVFPSETMRRAREPGVWLSLALVTAFFLGSNPAIKTTYKYLHEWPGHPGQAPVAWANARPVLQPWLDKAPVVLTPNDLHTIYYFGEYDYIVGITRVNASDTGAEFGLWDRGVPAVSTAESLRTIMACYRRGLYLGTHHRWRNTIYGLPDDAADYLVAHAERIPMPEEWDLVAYAWENAEAGALPECASLPRLYTGHGQ